MQIYEDFTDEVSVFIGPDNERRFFQMDRFHGNRNLGWWRGDRCDSVYGGTEGVSYHQGVRKEDELRYFRKTMCRVMPLYYARESVSGPAAPSCSTSYSAPAPGNGQNIEISRYRDIEISVWPTWTGSICRSGGVRPGAGAPGLPRPRWTPSTSLSPNSLYLSHKF